MTGERSAEKRVKILYWTVAALCVVFLAAGVGLYLGDSPMTLTVCQQTPSVSVAVQDRIDINTAGAAALMTLPGIGEVLAQRIVDYRTDNGPFKTLYALTEVYGIGDGKFEKIYPYIKIEDAQ